jgi:hypothetical protein
MNKQDEETLEQFHAAEKQGRVILESIRFYLAMPNAAAALTAAMVITEPNSNFDPVNRHDLRFYLIEQIWNQGSVDRWALRIVRWSSNQAADADVHDGRTFFEAIAAAYGGTCEGISLFFHHAPEAKSASAVN